MQEEPTSTLQCWRAMKNTEEQMGERLETWENGGCHVAEDGNVATVIRRND